MDLFSGGVLSGKTTHKSSLCVIPQQSVFNYIQPLREKYDEQYERWMPHFNLVYPFCDKSEFDEVISMIEMSNIDDSYFDLLKEEEIVIDTISYFEQSDKITIWIGPSKTELWQELYNRLCKLFPEYVKQKKFIPHLTIAQFKGERNDFNKFFEEIKSQFKTFTFKLSHLYLISRDDSTPFKIIHTI